MKGVMRFGKKGKLSPRYIGLFEILEMIGDVAYKLAFPPSLDSVHNVFHISMLKKYIQNSSNVLSYEPLKLSSDLSYEKLPVQILEREENKLRSRKFLWSRYFGKEYEIRNKYPTLFDE